MHLPLHPSALLSILSALLSLLALIAIWRRPAPGSLNLSLLLASMLVWSGLAATRWMDIPLATKVLWFNTMYMAVAALPTLFLLFILEFTGNMNWLTPRRLWLLAVHPLASLLLVWTNQYHHIYYLSVRAAQYNEFATIQFVRGPWHFANLAYSYLIIIAALIVLVSGAIRSGPMYRQQYGMVLFGSLLPWIGSIYTESNYNVLAGIDLVPITLGLSGAIFVFAMLRVHFLGLIPVARSYVIENIQDGILVLDARGRIVDINPIMENFLENRLSFYLGRNASELFSTWLYKAEVLWHEQETHVELKLPRNPSCYLDVRMTPLYDRNRRLNGRLLVFHDITERKQVEKRLRYVNDRLQSQLIEIGLLQSKLREQAIRDPLTNLFNRRYLEETLDRELARAAREGYSICLIMIDLDHFKRINDTHGHEAGDQVLKTLAETLSHESRRGDFACRYGGEEFVVVLPNITMDMAYPRAEALRNILHGLRIPYGYYNLKVTVSMGIACYPVNGQSRQEILRAADRAMYAAKEAGRNHILSYDQLKLSEEVPGD